MTLTAQQQAISIPDAEKLFVSLELSVSKWKAAISDGKRPAKIVTVEAGDIGGLLGKARKLAEKMGLGPTCPILVCQEAGRDGFWIHRQLCAEGVTSLVVDSSSIEVSRRMRRTKTDRLDALKLVQMLIRHDRGEKVWSVLRPPSVEQEDLRVLHRERATLVQEIQREANRIRSCLARHGINGLTMSERLPVDALRDWAGNPLPSYATAMLKRNLARYKVLKAQLRDVEQQQQQMLKTEGDGAETSSVAKAKMLMNLKGIGRHGSWLLAFEFFWRTFRNGREVGSAAGLTGSPYLSGNGGHDQGISKAGNPRIRGLAVELAWMWLRYQPQSALSQWFQRKWGNGTSRSRRVGIVALSRRLLIALWRYVDQGLVPEGASLKAA